jgi:hypothetical protein
MDIHRLGPLQTTSAYGRSQLTRNLVSSQDLNLNYSYRTIVGEDQAEGLEVQSN